MHKARVHPVKIRHQRMANGIAAVPLIGVTLIDPIVDMQRRTCRPHFLSGAVQQRTNDLAPHRRNAGESSQPGAPSQAEQHGLHRIRKRVRRGDPITVQRLKKGVPRLPGIRLNAHTGSLGLSGCVDCFFKIRQMQKSRTKAASARELSPRMPCSTWATVICSCHRSLRLSR